MFVVLRCEFKLTLKVRLTLRQTRITPDSVQSLHNPCLESCALHIFFNIRHNASAKVKESELRDMCVMVILLMLDGWAYYM